MTFEEALANLEKIVKQLESGECSLEQSVSLYEEAIKLSKDCTEKLNDAKLKITQISELEKAD